jgi:hypothetical protein
MKLNNDNSSSYRTIRTFIFISFLFFSNIILAKNYYVSNKGNDSDAGSILRPFSSIQKAASIMIAGDICFIRGGIYHETVIPKNSGMKGMPIVFRAYKDEFVIIDGTKTVQSLWQKYKNGIYKTKISADKIQQLFADTSMMVEARWPNYNNQLFSRSNWASTEKGSEHGKIICDAIAETGIDWTGAMAYLNVAHQWWTWNRKITEHKKGSNELKYDADLIGLCSYTPEFMNKKELEEKWADDYFYLFGKLEALDVPNEWFFDEKTKELYFYPPNNQKPNDFSIRYKFLDYGFTALNKNYIEIDGLNFFGTSFKFENCNYININKCNLKFPTYTRTITEYDANRKESIITKVIGDHNVVNEVSISNANNMGLMMMGNFNTVCNSIIHDINWSGTLIYPALQLSSSPNLGVNWFNTIQYPPTERTIENSEVTSFGNIAKNNTLYNGGGALLVYQAANTIIEYNHVYDGGKACKDVSLIYGCWPFSRGSEVRYNWVHGCKTDGHDGRESGGGIGIRADDQSRNNRFHHNVIWNCGMAGIVAKGEDNLVYNNTIFDIKANGVPRMYIMLDKSPEPYKVWAVRWPILQTQNVWSKVFNNLTYNICGKNNPKDTLNNSENIFNNFKMNDETLPLEDITKFNFKLKDKCDLIDKGIIIPNNKYKGKAPDIGAYEFGDKYWIPGANWKENNNWLNFLINNN